MADFVLSRSAQDADRPLGERDYIVKATWGYFEYGKPAGYFFNDTNTRNKHDAKWQCPDVKRPRFVPGTTIKQGLQAILDFEKACDQSFEKRRREY